jgi:long-chain fatty acid transport protein
MPSAMTQRPSGGVRGALCAGLAMFVMGSLLPVDARASDGYFQNGYGVRTKGMGGAGIAFPQEALSITANPASAVALGNRFEFDAEFIRPFRGATIRGNSLGPDESYSGNGLRRFVVPEFAVTRQLGPRWAVGLAMYGNGGLDTKYGINPYRRFGATGTAGINLGQVLFSPTVAYRLAEHHSIGLSLNVLYQTFSAYGLKRFAVLSEDPGAFSDRATDQATGIGVRLGYLGRVTPWLQLGAMWQSQTIVDNFNRYKGLFADHGNLNLPSAFGAGGDVTLLPGLDVALDVTRIRYHEIKSIGNPIDLVYSGVLLGASNGPGFSWHDITAIKVGANWHATDRLELRVGYNHSSAAISNNETFSGILAPGTIEHQYTAGASWKLSSKWDISIDGLYAPSVTMKGAPNVIPASYGGGTVDLVSNVLAFGGGAEYHF